MPTHGPDEVIYEVECSLDSAIVEAFDAWLPGHVRAVLACEGFTGAEIQWPGIIPGEPVVRRTQYRLRDAAALERYLTEDAPRLRADALARFGDKASFTRRVLRPQEVTGTRPAAPASVRCGNCDAVVTGRYCAECGQSAAGGVPAISDVTHDVVHSALHLDSRVWRTLRSLVLRPGELTREFIAGRRQRYLPPFRLYLVISVAFFALSALLPAGSFVDVAGEGGPVIAPGGGGECSVEIDAPPLDRLNPLFAEACRRLEADGGRRLGEVFLRNAPKLMFLFLPVMAAVAMLFYWHPRRLYAEHLVLFLHTHAFLFLYLIATSLLEQPGRLGLPGGSLFGVVAFALTAYLPYYLFRAMRVVYGEGRARTAAKFVAIGSIYFLLLGVTMAAGLVYSVLSL